MPENQRKKRWSAEVKAHSDALDLESKVFEKENAGEIARSLKRSAETLMATSWPRVIVGAVDFAHCRRRRWALGFRTDLVVSPQDRGITG